ncbi:DUF6473 family protein [Cognatishimia sp.]|uniref:DUF6473 family protein n=1 Tax=Cognatishimia sp. TaxID=2211648 RepID=UPI003511F0EE|nr:hypothetical protein [Cognatishimia sp.]
MSFHHSVQRSLDYNPVRYGTSRISFRGPTKDLGGRYVAFLGGSETYGKFIQEPFPDLVEQALEMTCVNLGYMNAGIDAFVHEAEMLSLAARAEITVIQLMGAQNMSNRLYRVHPRRNDRFLTASSMMKSVFREVDFTEYNFTRHMLQDIAAQASDRFSFVTGELRTAWSSRMLQLLDALPGKKVLLWFSDHRPPKESQILPGKDPWFVDKGMIDRLRDHVDGIVEVRVTKKALEQGSKGKHFSPVEWSAAQHMFGPMAHAEAAKALVDTLKPMISKKNRPH